MATSSPAGLMTKLAVNGIRQKCRKIMGRPVKPSSVSLEITRHCVARCLMCNIWKTPKDAPELSVADWLNLVENDLFSNLVEIDITGGEPFLKKDFYELFSGISALASKKLSSLKSIAVTTNGYLTENILTTVDRVLPLLKEQDIDLVVVCALDAVGPLHDKIRRLDGIFQKVSDTIDGLLRLRKEHNNLIIGLKATILPLNVGELHAIADFAKKRNIFTIISPRIITGGRYLNAEMKSTFIFSDEQVKQMVEFFGSGDSRWSYHNQIVIDSLLNGKTHKPCSCGFNYFFVRSNGDIHLCPLIEHCFGNVNQQDIKEIYNSSDANEFRKQVENFQECCNCTEPGLERYALPFEGFKYLKMIPKLGLNNFVQLHSHMGLDKYI